MATQRVITLISICVFPVWARERANARAHTHTHTPRSICIEIVWPGWNRCAWNFSTSVFSVRKKPQRSARCLAASISIIAHVCSPKGVQLTYFFWAFVFLDHFIHSLRCVSFRLVSFTISLLLLFQNAHQFTLGHQHLWCVRAKRCLVCTVYTIKQYSDNTRAPNKWKMKKPTTTFSSRWCNNHKR